MIKELLAMEPYDIYNHDDLEMARISELAEEFSAENIDLQDYFKLSKFRTKFCWINPIKIINAMKYPQKMRGLPFLFEILQDANWPVFPAAVEALKLIRRSDIIPYVEKYLKQAYLEDDDMWIAGIYILAQELYIQPQDFQDIHSYELFKYRNF